MRIRRLKRRAPRKFQLRKAMFVLPNLFTLSSVFCGLLAITKAIEGGNANLQTACLSIFFGLFFDMADGRVARLTKTQSDFGVQIDSLADTVTFGVAPAIVAWAWGLSNFDGLGLFTVFMFLSCGVIRLARFNVMAARNSGPDGFFLGIPIPLGAGLIISPVLYDLETMGNFLNPQLYIALVIFVSLLMVSNVRYRSFKKTAWSAPRVAFLLSLIGGFIVLAFTLKTSLTLFLYASSFTMLGVAESVLGFLFKRKRQVDHELSAALDEPPEFETQDPAVK